MAAKKVIRFAVLGLALAAGGTWGYHYYTTGRWVQSTNNAYVRNDITAITSRIPGEVTAVQVRSNQKVKKGELLLRIDARDYLAKVASARAQVAQAEAAIDVNARSQTMQMAMIDQAGASLAAAQAENARALKEQMRAQSLVQDGVATIARLDNSTASSANASAMVRKSIAGVSAAKSQAATMQAESSRLAALLAASKAALTLAELDLEATELRAPIDGVVADVSAKVGERIGGGMRLLSLVSSGVPWVEANYKETQLTRIVVGQTAEIELDAFPNTVIQATVESVSPASGAEFSLLPPDNATGNFTKIIQRVPVKLRLTIPENLNDKLRSGMSADVRINTLPSN